MKEASRPPASLRLFALTILLCYRANIVDLGRASVRAVEIEATSEWRLLEEGDTIPKGLHVRMDLSTGQKWAKLIDEEEEKNGVGEVNYIEIDGDGSQSAISVLPNRTVEEEKEEEEESEAVYDYEMMHRTLSKLPNDEKATFGGLPDVAESLSSDDPKVVEEFQARMKQIWELRQEQLRDATNEMADLPKLLKIRIESMREYLELGRIVSWTPPDEEEEEDQEDVTSPPEDLIDINWVLKDLEYHLSDLDMARDFYTLGGWPVLVSLLTDDAYSKHLENRTVTDEEMQTIQSVAAWALGTAVKNTLEFSPWGVEPVSLNGSSVTALSLLVDKFRSPRDLSTALRTKGLYALGSVLRGNRMAQSHFVRSGGPHVLLNAIQMWIADGEWSVAARMLSLSGDLISDVVFFLEESNPAENAMLAGLTTEEWCGAALQLISKSEESNAILEKGLIAIEVMLPFCDGEEDGPNIIHVVGSMRQGWDGDDGMDEEWKKILTDLADNIVNITL